MVGREELISLEDIKCEEIVGLIEDATEIVLKFSKILNASLKKTQLKEVKILISRRCVDVYKDDGYTKTPGYAYKVYWCFPYIDSDENVHKILYYESYMWPSYFLFFELTMSEKIEDNDFIGDNFFHLFVTDDGINKNSKIVTYNSNFSLMSMLSEKNIYRCIEFINKAYKRWKKEQEILKKISNMKLEVDVKDYITKNTIK